MSDDGTKPKSVVAIMDDVDRIAKIDNKAGKLASELVGAVQSASSMMPPPSASKGDDDAPKAKRQDDGKIARGGESGPIAAEAPKAAPKRHDGDAERRARSGPFEGKHRAPINLVAEAGRIPPRPAPQTSAKTHSR